MVSQPNIPVPAERIAEFCLRHGIKELALFGSVLRDDFGPESDVDVLVEFLPGHGLTFHGLPVMLAELRDIFGREVDLVEKDRLKNPYRRRAILDSHRVVYAA